LAKGDFDPIRGDYFNVSFVDNFSTAMEDGTGKPKKMKTETVQEL